MQTARVLAAVFFSFTTVAVYARETRTATFQPDQPVSGQTTLEIVLDTEVRNLYNKVQIIQSYSRLIRDWSELLYRSYMWTEFAGASTRILFSLFGMRKHGLELKPHC